MRHLFRIATLLVAGAFAAPAHAGHVDPYAAIEKAFTLFKDGGTYQESRAIFSQALRDGRHDGKLDPGFAILYVMYADLTRFDGNPAFALQLADEGIALALTEAPVDEDVKNSLLVSRAYALADLGQYQQAVESVAITALWMGERFGDKAREELEATARGWAGQATAGGGDGKFPSAVQLSIDLLKKADEALAARDTRTALALASRATLPDGTSLAAADVAFMNARSHSIAGLAYAYEGRSRLAFIALRRAADLVVAEPWDGKSKPRLRGEVEREDGWKVLAWTVFSHLASAAVGVKELDAAQASIEAASPYARTSADRFSLLAQQAGIAFTSNDYAKAAEVFERGEREAKAAGDTENAALASLYLAIARLFLAPEDNNTTEQEALLKAASHAADVAAGDPQMVEYVLTTAVRAVGHRGSVAAALPLARRAFEVFQERQKAMAGYEAAQASGRRERRRFLEMLIAGEYAAANAK